MHEVVCTGFSLFLLPLQALFELFQKADVLNPSLNCFVKFTMSLVDKVRIGTCNLAFVISNFAESQSGYSLQSSLVSLVLRLLQNFFQ